MVSTNPLHVFLCPLKFADEAFIRYILELSTCSTERFSFILSFPGKSITNELLKEIKNHRNIYVNLIKDDVGRCEHWQLLPSIIENFTDFDTFSYLFMGDEVLLNKFPETRIISKKDFYLNDYFLNDYARKKSSTYIFDFNDNVISKINFLFGKPCFSPLQKIIFNKRTARAIIFNNNMPFVSDQLMVLELIKMGFSFEYIKVPFYKLNQKKRSYENKLSFSRKIKEQIYLYLQVGCYIGIPMVLIRTCLKKIGEIK